MPVLRCTYENTRLVRLFNIQIEMMITDKPQVNLIDLGKLINSPAPRCSQQIVSSGQRGLHDATKLSYTNEIDFTLASLIAFIPCVDQSSSSSSSAGAAAGAVVFIAGLIGQAAGAAAGSAIGAAAGSIAGAAAGSMGAAAGAIAGAAAGSIGAVVFMAAAVDSSQPLLFFH